MTSTLSQDTKDALARLTPSTAHCREALLAGLTMYGARGGSFVTHRNAVARLFRKLSGSTSLVKAKTYRVALPDGVKERPRKPVRRCDRVMEARAAFLACGSLSAGAQGYHLEFVTRDEDRRERLDWILRATGAPPKRLKRQSHDVLYYKDFEAIVAFLGLIGAHAAVLQLEDLHALKETKNRIHRLVNTEAANLERVTNAAAAQRDIIEFIGSAHGLHHLSRPLREIAELRLQYPDESLAELGRRCNPPVTKPAVNTRLGTLVRLARRLRGETASR